MSVRAIHGKRPVYSASAAAEAVGRAIHEIKHQDGLTWSDMGAVLGKSEDQVAKYADGSAIMDFITYGRGKREWNGRFTGYFERLCIDSRPGGLSDHAALTHLLLAATGISEALDDGEISTSEIRDNRQTLENARNAIDMLLRRLKVEVA